MIKKYANNAKKKRYLNRKNTTRAGQGVRIMYSLTSGYGWKDKWIRPFAYLRRDRRSSANNPKYSIQVVKYINSYHTRDIMMNQIRSNKFLKDKRFSFDGASVHTSSGRSKDWRTGRSTFNMFDYYTKHKIKTFGFAGKNVNNKYSSTEGWAGHSFDKQMSEKLFAIVGKKGSYYVSFLKDNQRNIVNVLKCYQKAWDEVSIETIKKIYDNSTWINWKECIDNNGDYGMSYLLKKT